MRASRIASVLRAAFAAALFWVACVPAPAAAAAAGGSSGGTPPADPALAAAVQAVSALQFSKLITAMSFGPAPGDIALTFADGSAEALVGGRPVLQLQAEPSPIHAVTWIPDTYWLLVDRGSLPPEGPVQAAAAPPLVLPGGDEELQPVVGGVASPLPACESGGAAASAASVAWWCAGQLHVLSVPEAGTRIDPASAAAYGLPAGSGPAAWYQMNPTASAAIGSNGVVYNLQAGVASEAGSVGNGSIASAAWSPQSADALAVVAGAQLGVWEHPAAQAPTAPLLSGLRNVLQVQWAPDGSAVWALDLRNAPAVDAGSAPLYAVDRVADGHARIWMQGRLGYVLGLDPSGTILWREEGVAPTVFSAQPPQPGPGPFSLQAVTLRPQPQGVAAVIEAALAAARALYGSAAAGEDISFPNCNKLAAAPSGFVIVGVNGGRPFVPNPCLTAEAAWARLQPQKPTFYMNLAAPESLADPSALIGPFDSLCSGLECAALNYGYNAAAYAWQQAVSAGADPSAMWWLDIETANHWVAPSENADVIAGALAYFGPVTLPGGQTVDVAAHRVAVGVYSVPTMWTRIAGAYRPGVPVWVGPVTQSAPACGDPAFGGGRVWLLQTPVGAVDLDYAC